MKTKTINHACDLSGSQLMIVLIFFISWIPPRKATGVVESFGFHV